MAQNGTYHGSPPQDISSPLLPNGMPAPYFIENGRCYGNFQKGKYKFPCDSEELNRLDILHKLITLARNPNGPFAGLHKYPLPPGPKIIDLGCGSGIWAVDVADRYGPDSEVVGIDLSLHQPALIPPRLSFLQGDFEEEKGWQQLGSHARDLIRGQMLLGSVYDWHALYQQIFRHLKPGTGIFEQIEIDFMPIVEEGELAPDSNLLCWARELRAAMIAAEQSIEMNPATQAILESIGFTDVEHECIRIPYNTWPSDEHQKLLGRWFNLAMNQGLMGLSLRPLTKLSNWKYEQVTDLVRNVKREICDRQIRAFCHLHIYTARRPE